MIKLLELVKSDKIAKLQKPLYHGTSCSKIESIKKYGLGIDYPPVHVETERPKRGRIAKKGVYVTDNIEDAIPYAYDASKEVKPSMLDMADADENNMCIVKIECMPETAKVGPDGYGSLMINQGIPANCVKILTPEYLRKFLKVETLFDAL